MIIDCHVHLNRYGDETKEALPQTIEALQTEMRRNRVDFALALSSYRVSPGRPSTRDLVHATRDMKNIFIVAGVSFLNHTPEDVAELREYMQDGHVRGLKFYCGYEPFYPHDPKMAPVVALAKEFKVPVMVHCGDTYTPKGKLKYAHPLQIDEFAVDNPEVDIVICHLGNPWIIDTMEVVYKNANVYTDISGLVLGSFSDRFEQMMTKRIQEMLLYGVNPDSVLYGTDWPISSMESYLKFVDELKMPKENREKVLWKNSEKLYNINVADSPFAKKGMF